jgi:uncharacterized membrane protein YoaK (UPF0700 family)
MNSVRFSNSARETSETPMLNSFALLVLLWLIPAIAFAQDPNAMLDSMVGFAVVVVVIIIAAVLFIHWYNKRRGGTPTGGNIAAAKENLGKLIDRAERDMGFDKRTPESVLSAMAGRTIKDAHEGFTPCRL